MLFMPHEEQGKLFLTRSLVPLGVCILLFYLVYVFLRCLQNEVVLSV